MVVDTSAVMALLEDEADADAITQALEQADERLLSAVSLLEAGMLATSRKGAAGRQQLDALIAAAEFEVVAFDAEQAWVACLAFERYGKGRHPAALNVGDCAVYALAATRALPLLFKGQDFACTDLVSAWPR